MSPRRRKLAIAGALAVSLLVVGYAALHLLVRSEWLQAKAQSELSERTGYTVQFENLRLSPWLGLVLSEVAVSKDGRTVFQAERVVCFLSPFDLFSGRISRLSLQRPIIRLSLQDLSAPAGGTTSGPSVGALSITDGALVLETDDEEVLTLQSIFLKGENVSLGGEAGLEIRTYVPAVNGTATLSLSGGSEEGRIEIGVDQGEEKAPAGFPRKRAEGDGVLRAGFEIRKEGGVYRMTGSGAVDRFRAGSETISGEFNSAFELDAEGERLFFSANLEMPRVPLMLLPAVAAVDPGPASATVQGIYMVRQNRAAFEKLSLISGMGTLDGGGVVSFGESPIGLSATLRLRDVEIGSLKSFLPTPFDVLTYRGKLAADLNVSGAAGDPLVSGIAWNNEGKIEGKEISVARLSMKVPFEWKRSTLRIKAGQWEAKDLSVGGTGKIRWGARAASARGDLTQGPRAPLQAAADFQVIDGAFVTPDESKIGEHLNMKGSFSCRDCAGDAFFSGKARIESLEVLWDKFFGDFKNQKASIEVAGGYRRETDEVTFDPLRISMGSMGLFQVKGSVRHPAAGPTFDLEALTGDFHPGHFYDFFVRDTFKASYPILDQIGLSGKSDAKVRAHGSLASFALEGMVRIEEGWVRDRSGRWSLGPLALDLPLKLRYPQAPEQREEGSPPVGILSIRSIQTGSIAIPEVHVPLVLWNNALRFPRAVDIAVFGGGLRIDTLAWRDVVSDPGDFSFALTLRELRLLEMTEAMGWHRFGGTLSGSIPEVRWARDSLTTSGGISLDVFGGRVAVREMEVVRPLSPVRSVKMSVTLKDLDLEQASATFDFGRISGILDGTIEDLIVTNGQAAEFKADIHTVERAGVSQWISVEALNKITVLSSGNQAGFIYGGLARFFDFYRYSKLGFKAALKNDRMTLRGIETRDGQEYLVVGTLLPPTVNIVSHTQEIGFSELLRRLERVQETGGSGSSGQP